jgi:hypothetical protein
VISSLLAGRLNDHHRLELKRLARLRALLDLVIERPAN